MPLTEVLLVKTVDTRFIRLGANLILPLNAANYSKASFHLSTGSHWQSIMEMMICCAAS